MEDPDLHNFDGYDEDGIEEDSVLAVKIAAELELEHIQQQLADYIADLEYYTRQCLW